MLNLGHDVLAEFAAFGASFDVEDGMTVFPCRRFAPDRHRDADEFIAASPAQREYIRARHAARKPRPCPELDRATCARPRRKSGQALAAHEERALRDLASRGLSAREIERRTGIGRATVARRLAGIPVQKTGRKKRAS